MAELDRSGEPDPGTAADAEAIGLTGARFGSRAARRPRHGTQQPADGGDPSLAGGPADGHRYRADHAAGAEVGMAGARFGPGIRRRREPEHAAGLDGYPGGGPVGPPDPELGLAGARFNPFGARRAADPAPPPTPAPDWAPAPAPEWSAEPAGIRAVPDVPPPDQPWTGPANDETAFIRPYIRTGGRTRGPANLGIETLVSVNPAAPAGALQPTDRDHHLVVGLCRVPRSVAEVAALTSLPLGVARVLLADMARIGVIRVHKTATTANGSPDLALMQRVLAGLRRL